MPRASTGYERRGPRHAWERWNELAESDRRQLLATFLDGQSDLFVIAAFGGRKNAEAALLWFLAAFAGKDGWNYPEMTALRDVLTRVLEDAQYRAALEECGATPKSADPRTFRARLYKFNSPLYNRLGVAANAGFDRFHAWVIKKRPKMRAPLRALVPYSPVLSSSLATISLAIAFIAVLGLSGTLLWRISRRPVRSSSQAGTISVNETVGSDAAPAIGELDEIAKDGTAPLPSRQIGCRTIWEDAFDMRRPFSDTVIGSQASTDGASFSDDRGGSRVTYGSGRTNTSSLSVHTGPPRRGVTDVRLSFPVSASKMETVRVSFWAYNPLLSAYDIGLMLPAGPSVVRKIPSQEWTYVTADSAAPRDVSAVILHLDSLPDGGGSWTFKMDDLLIEVCQ